MLKNPKTFLILGVIGLICSLCYFSLNQYKQRIQLEQSLSIAEQTISKQQLYIEEKDKKVKNLEKKYKEQLANKPNDECGNTIVPDSIKNWLLGE